MIGPLRSLAWLAGRDELVEAIDNSAYLIEDDIEVIAFGFCFWDNLIVAIRATYGRRNPYKQNPDQGLGQQSPSHTLIPSNNSSSHHPSSCQRYAGYPQPQRPLCANWWRGHGLQNPDLHNTTLWEPSLEFLECLGRRAGWNLPLEIAQQPMPVEYSVCRSVLLLRFSQRPILKTAAIV